MKNSVQDGKYLDLTAPSAMASGDARMIGGLLGVAVADIANGEVGAMAVEGVYELPKESAAAFTEGEICYWNAGANNFDESAVGRFGCAVAVEAAIATTTTVKVKLFGIAVAAVV